MPLNVARRQALQDRVTDQTVDALRDGRDVFIGAPTGFGKTATSLAIVKTLQFDHAGTDFRTLFVQDRIAIASQNRERADAHSLASTALWTDGDHAPRGQTVFSTVDTALSPQSSLQGFGLLVIDEAHHAGATRPGQPRGSEYTRLIDRLMADNPGLMIVAMSANTKRADGMPLHQRLAEATPVGVTYHEALEAGTIVPTRTIAPDYRLRNGLLVRDAVAGFRDELDPAKVSSGIEAMLTRGRPADFNDVAVSAWERSAGGQPTFAYAHRTKEAEDLAKAFRERGIPAETYHSGVDAATRNRRMEAFKGRGLPVLVSVDMLSEGIDVPLAAVTLNTKPITTANEMIQIIGRGQRAYRSEAPDGTPAHKESALHIDLGASTFLHGTSQANVAIEALGHHGGKATPMRVWKRVAADAFALRRNESTMFAVRMPDAAQPSHEYALYVRSEDRGRGARENGRTVMRASTPFASREEVQGFGRDQARANPRHYAMLESMRPDGSFDAPAGAPAGLHAPSETMLHAMSKASYEQSKGALAHLVAEDRVRARTGKAPVAARSASARAGGMEI